MAILVAGCGSGSCETIDGQKVCGDAAIAAANVRSVDRLNIAEAKREHDLCQSQLGAVIDDEERLDGRLVTGVSEEDYRTTVGSAEADANEIPGSQLSPTCAHVALAVGDALAQYAAAARTWLHCTEDDYGECDPTANPLKARLQKAWSRAEGHIVDAGHQLDRMLETPDELEAGAHGS